MCSEDGTANYRGPLSKPSLVSTELRAATEALACSCAGSAASAGPLAGAHEGPDPGPVR